MPMPEPSSSLDLMIIEAIAIISLVVVDAVVAFIVIHCR